LKQKKTHLKLAENILEITIDTNLVFATRLYDSLSGSKPSDLADRMTNLVLNVVSEDTLIFICILNILQLKKVRKKK